MSEFLKKLIKKDDELSINITNMIDVIFILLIFFMVSTQFKKFSIPIDLPKTETTESIVEKEFVNLAANEKQIELDGKIVGLNELQNELKNLVQKNPDCAIVFSGDKNISYERFLNIYSKIENSGIKRISIEHGPMDN